jgi:hypothetical protein
VSARVLVAHASKLGSTAAIADAMAQVLRDGGHQADSIPARDVESLDDWDGDLPITPHGAALTAGLGARDHRTFGGRLAPDAEVDPRILQTHRIGDFRDWRAIVDYAFRIGLELDEMTFPPSR